MGKNTSETAVILIDEAAASPPDALPAVLRSGAQRLVLNLIPACWQRSMGCQRSALAKRGSDLRRFWRALKA